MRRVRFECQASLGDDLVSEVKEIVLSGYEVLKKDKILEMISENWAEDQVQSGYRIISEEDLDLE